MAKLSRRKLAIYVADQLIDGNSDVLEEVAGLLIHDRRVRELDILVKDIEAELENRGMIVATVETAKELDEDSRVGIRQLLLSKFSGSDGKVYLRELVNPELIGGVKVSAPTATLDATVLKKLNNLRIKKI